MGNSTDNEGYEWKKCYYCESDYDKWCDGRVIEEKRGFPHMVEVKCRYCGAVYLVYSIVSWRIDERQGITNEKLWPGSIKEAGEKLLFKMSDKDRQLAKIRRSPRLVYVEDIGGAASYANGAFGLWEGNKELLDLCGTSDPSHAVMVIISSVCKALRENTGISDDWRDAVKYMFRVEEIPEEMKDYNYDQIRDALPSIYERLRQQREKTDGNRC